MTLRVFVRMCDCQCVLAFLSYITFFCECQYIQGILKYACHVLTAVFAMTLVLARMVGCATLREYTQFELVVLVS